MYSFLLSLHSLFRWLVLICLISSVVFAYIGWRRSSVFTPFANSLRHWTATLLHLQMTVGMTLYFKSPILQFPMQGPSNGMVNEQSFFRYVHLGLMLLAVLIVTVGSAKAKRKETDKEKYQTMLWWFGVGLIILFLAIPWPFSPVVSRPLARPF